MSLAESTSKTTVGVDPNLYPYPAVSSTVTATRYVGAIPDFYIAPFDAVTMRAGRHEALARAIAAQQVKQLEELAHIDYDLCLDDPDVRAVVAEALRWGALMELENA